MPNKASITYDTSYAKGLVKNYKDNQWDIINQVFLLDDIRDARCVWFSIEDLQYFLEQIQIPATPNSPVATGIRIYFGAYSDNISNPDHDNYNRLHTLLMIPTHPDAAGKDVDFDAFSGTSDFANLLSISALNQGHLIPPPFDLVGPDNMYQQGNLFMDYADNQ